MQVINTKTKKNCRCCKPFARKSKNKTTYVAFVLDRSGSMNSIKKEAVSGFNEQVDVIRKNASKGGDTFVSLWSFNEDVTDHFKNIPAEELDYITSSEYRPQGVTAMYDAVGDVLTYLEDFDEAGDTGFLIIVISDGMENASRRYRANDIKRKVSKLQETGRWTFAYVGSNQDLTNVEEVTGLKGSNWMSDAAGTKLMGMAMAATNVMYFNNRSKGATNMPAYSATLSENIAKPKEEA